MIQEINLSQTKKSVKWNRVWNSCFKIYNIVSLRLGPNIKKGEISNHTKAKATQRVQFSTTEEKLKENIGLSQCKEALIF